MRDIGPRPKAALIVGTIAATLAALTTVGCAPQYRSVDDSRAVPQPATQLTPSSTARALRTTSPDAPNDLKAGSSQQTFRTGQLTVDVTYSTTLPTDRWTPGVSKPIRVSLSALNNADSKQKIYLSKVTAAVTASDMNGPIGNPNTLTDSANIDPGYLVNFPYTYSQNFTVPALDEGALSVSLTFNYEFLCRVGDGKDYIKQTAASTVRVPLR